MQFEELAFFSFTPRDPTQDDNSTNIDLNYIHQEGNIFKRVDSYDFIHDTNSYTPMDIPQEFDDKYYSYLDEHYSLFDNCSGLIYMQKITNKDIANHTKEINNNVTRVNFDVNYSYQRKKKVVNKFDKIF